MLEVSSSKPLASESKGFAFWVELVAPGLPSAVTSPMWFASYCIGARVLPCAHPKGSGCGFPLSSKSNNPGHSS
uniref:Putative ovule protein n=1 Tax=Solanum chacoense TaxID=4108 RepID=A0A0V0HDU6_SOLCH